MTCKVITNGDTTIEYHCLSCGAVYKSGSEVITEDDQDRSDRVSVSRVMLGIGMVCASLAAVSVLRDSGPAATGFGLAGVALAIASALIRRGYWSCR
jgi:small-conductance mechanosensitive channel